MDDPYRGVLVCLPTAFNPFRKDNPPNNRNDRGPPHPDSDPFLYFKKAVWNVTAHQVVTNRARPFVLRRRGFLLYSRTVQIRNVATPGDLDWLSSCLVYSSADCRVPRPLRNAGTVYGNLDRVRDPSQSRMGHKVFDGAPNAIPWNNQL